MRENGIVVERTRKSKATTDSDHRFNIAANQLDRDVTADQPNQKWAGPYRDIAAQCTAGQWFSNRMKRDLAIRALKMAISFRAPPKGCDFHRCAARGNHYCLHDYQKILRQHGFRVSMSGKGNCHDNATVLRRENSPPDCFPILLTFFKTIKAELI